MSMRDVMEQVLAQRRFAVAGASRDPDKPGHSVYTVLKAAGRTVYAVNPNAETIDGDSCYPSLDTLPGPVDCLVTVTQPEVTQSLLIDAGRLGIPYVWMQPGSDSLAALHYAQAFSMQVVAGGPCIMLALKRAAV
ncbi:MAG: CoA-binding protein [Armatimonadetes bacterium]|nr:CoA-binding protein [Armatimonadota bacterium]MDE2206196.1 CoA-binding protein [Armatimonadota bacterium]